MGAFQLYRLNLARSQKDVVAKDLGISRSSLLLRVPILRAVDLEKDFLASTSKRQDCGFVGAVPEKCDLMNSARFSSAVQYFE